MKQLKIDNIFENWRNIAKHDIAISICIDTFSHLELERSFNSLLYKFLQDKSVIVKL